MNIHRFYVIGENNEVIDWILNNNFIRKYRFYELKKYNTTKVMVHGLWLWNEDAVVFKLRWAGSEFVHTKLSFPTIIIPMIRRIMPSVIASEIIGVQPMTASVGQIYTLRAKYYEDNT